MLLKGSFRVTDSWSGASKKDGSPRASVTLTDTTEGGQLNVSFADGKIPPLFAMDALVTDIQVKPYSGKFGLQLSYIAPAKK